MLTLMISRLKTPLKQVARLCGYDRRRRARIRTGVTATLCGALGGVRAIVLDASRDGVRICCEEPRAVGEVAFIRFPHFGLMGFVQVRHCSSCECGYKIGLAFREPLTRATDGFLEGTYECLEPSSTCAIAGSKCST